MILSEIEFKNYRCFLNGSIKFQADKPINLILGVNGSGKTELLYAIWYVLHGFDFSTLKSKENDPFSLNSQVYQRVQSDPDFYDAYSEVTLTFQHEFRNTKRTYVLSRREEYIKNRKTSTGEKATLYTYSEHGEKSPLETDQQKIKEIIEQIIPYKVLSGIMFDGERMKNLSSEDENSIKAIEGSIEDVTNLKLFTSLINDLNSLGRKYQTELRKIGRRSSDDELEEVSQAILNAEYEQSAKKVRQAELKTELPKLEGLILSLSQELRGFSEAKVLENDRVNKKKNLEKIEKEIEKLRDSLRDKEFKNSSILLSNKLLVEVDSLIENNKLPKGLTSNAVESILEEVNCICGRPHDLNTKNKLNELIRILPPENLNALINEWVIDLKRSSSDKDKEIDEIFDTIAEKEHEIENLKEEINYLSSQISNIDNQSLKDKETKKIEYEKKLNKYKDELYAIDKSLSIFESHLNNLRKRQSELTRSSIEASFISRKLDFIKKSELMVDKIKEINMDRALKEINTYMTKAYEDLSEDYPRGRRVYITQFIKTKYKLVAYYENDLKSARNSSELSLLRKKYKELDFDNNEHLEEALIMEVAQNNSTGQSKIMTMSFVKSILDFSSKSRKDEFSVKKQYPLVLDAPFSEISGDNLTKSAKNLYKFNNQIILLSDPNTYGPLKEYLKDNIGQIYYFDKNEGQSSTTIRKG